MTIRRTCGCIALFSLTVVGACAHGTADSRQPIEISSKPAGATVQLSNGKTCMTPCVVEANRYEILAVTFKKPGCVTEKHLIVPEMKPEKDVDGGMKAFVLHPTYRLQPNPIVGDLICEPEIQTASVAGG